LRVDDDLSLSSSAIKGLRHESLDSLKVGMRLVEDGVNLVFCSPLLRPVPLGSCFASITTVPLEEVGRDVIRSIEIDTSAIVDGGDDRRLGVRWG